MNNSISITIYYEDILSNNPREYIMNDVKLKVGSYGDEFIIIDNDLTEIISAIKIGESYFLHSIDGPCIHNESSTKVSVIFANMGKVCRIEDTNLDEDIKVMLKLKYGECVSSGIYTL